MPDAYCLCGEGEHGLMISCDADNCPVDVGTMWTVLACRRAARIFRGGGGEGGGVRVPSIEGHANL